MKIAIIIIRFIFIFFGGVFLFGSRKKFKHGHIATTLHRRAAGLDAEIIRPKPGSATNLFIFSEGLPTLQKPDCRQAGLTAVRQAGKPAGREETC